MVAASQPLAVQAGLEALRAGGNALDAAVATVATLCVVEPCSTGIGGDAFALIWQADEGKLYGLNASGPAPGRLTADLLRQRGHDSMPQSGALSVTVPGAVRGWQIASERFGRLGLDRLLGRAIAYAEAGFPVSELIAGSWQRSERLLGGHEASRRVWLPGGHAPLAGQLFRNPEQAATLRALADEGPDAFYEGPIARQVAQTVQTAGGVMTEEDLAGYMAEWVEPISAEVGPGQRVYEIPPNGQGLTALLALKLVAGQGLDAVEYGTADYWHLLIEAIKLAFADAAAYIGDPRYADLPVTELLDDSYLAGRRAMIDRQRAGQPRAGDPRQQGDTIYLCTADGQGNMVSWIQSLYEGFGSGLTAGTTGVQLQNRGAGFVLDDGHPNQVAPGKRPYHTIIPAFISRDGRPWCAFGVMGGFMQPQGHLQVGLNLLRYGMSPQAALDAPRFRWFRGKDVALEAAVPQEVKDELARRGHVLFDPVQWRVGFGGGQVIIRDPDSGVLIAGSDPRKDGCAAGI
jgi:gamma-glutamyltranspeptidase/glutathione hydrolase